MTYPLNVPLTNGSAWMVNVGVGVGETLFVLGANGSGKSSLMHRKISNARFLVHVERSSSLKGPVQAWICLSTDCCSQALQ